MDGEVDERTHPWDTDQAGQLEGEPHTAWLKLPISLQQTVRCWFLSALRDQHKLADAGSTVGLGFLPKKKVPLKLEL